MIPKMTSNKGSDCNVTVFLLIFAKSAKQFFSIIITLIFYLIYTLIPNQLNSNILKIYQKINF